MWVGGVYGRLTPYPGKLAMLSLAACAGTAHRLTLSLSACLNVEPQRMPRHDESPLKTARYYFIRRVRVLTRCVPFSEVSRSAMVSPNYHRRSTLVILSPLLHTVAVADAVTAPKRLRLCNSGSPSPCPDLAPPRAHLYIPSMLPPGVSASATPRVRQNCNYRATRLATRMKLLSLIIIVSLSAVSEAFQVRHGGVRRAPQKKASPVEMSLRSEMKKMSG